MKQRIGAALTVLVILILFTACRYSDSPPAARPEPPPIDQTLPASDDSALPENGLLAIFRSDFPFVTQDGEVSPVSTPPARPACGVKLLGDGSQRLQWRLHLLESARRSVRLQTFIFTADDAGNLIADGLKQLRQKGREIKLTIDSYTKFMPGDRLLYNDLELKGIKVMGFEPVYLLGVAEQKIWNVKDVNLRFHEKYFVIDDQVAIVGGTNVANEYYRYGEDPASMWRDQDVVLTGPVVHDVARAFDDNYEYFKLRREGRLPTNRAAWFKKAWWEVSGSKPPPVEADPKAESVPLPDPKLDDDSATVRFLRHRPRAREDYIFQAYLHLFEHARESILIENAYFVPDRTLLNSLMKAARRGVTVRIITNSEQTNDVAGMAPLTRYTYLGLIRNGAQVYEWRGDHPGQGCLHSKFAVIDGRVIIMGSCNLDPRSLGLNSEDVVLIHSPKAAAVLTALVERMDLPVCDRVTPDQAVQWHKPEDHADKFKLIFGQAVEDWY